MISFRCKPHVILFVISAVILSVSAVHDVHSWQNALCSVKILGLDDHIICETMRDGFTLAAGNNVSLQLDNQTNTITIHAISSEPGASLGRTLVASGEQAGYGITLQNVQAGDTIIITFKGDYTATVSTYESIWLYVNGIPKDGAGFTIPVNTTVPFTLLHHYTATGSEDLAITITSSEGVHTNGKIVWEQYR